MAGAEPGDRGPATFARQRLDELTLPAGLPALTGPLRLAVALTDDPGVGFEIHVGTDWAVSLAELAPGIVYDAALAVPAAAAAAIVGGSADLGGAAHHGTFTGSMASQSALAFIIECAAERSGGRP